MACFDRGCSRTDCHYSEELTSAVVEQAVVRHGYRDDPFFYLRQIAALRDVRNALEIHGIEHNGGSADLDYEGLFSIQFVSLLYT